MKKKQRMILGEKKKIFIKVRIDMKDNKAKKNMEKHYSSVYKKWFKGFTL